jgi:hypothetical protein
VSARRCNVGVEPGDPVLPVAGTGRLSAVRKSKNARWRAFVLILLHVVIAAHATHFLLAGRTLSPVEPSEAMYTFELGQVNAGFIFLVAALVATLVFGRFVCGWGSRCTCSSGPPSIACSTARPPPFPDSPTT